MYLKLLDYNNRSIKKTFIKTMWFKHPIYLLVNIYCFTPQLRIYVFGSNSESFWSIVVSNIEIEE